MNWSRKSTKTKLKNMILKCMKRFITYDNVSSKWKKISSEYLNPFKAMIIKSLK